MVVFVVKLVLWICECVFDRFLVILFKLWIVDWKWFCKVFNDVCCVLIVEIVLLIVVSVDVVLVIDDIEIDLIFRFDVLKLFEWDRFILIVWLLFVLMRNVVEKLFFNKLILVNWVFVDIWEIFVINVVIFCCSVIWLVELLILFWDWIVNWWICCKLVVIFDSVFFVVCVNEIVLLVLCMVWFKFWICVVRWFEICRFVVLLVVLLIWKFDDKCLNDVFSLLLILNNWCCVFRVEMFVFIYKDII